MAANIEVDSSKVQMFNLSADFISHVISPVILDSLKEAEPDEQSTLVTRVTVDGMLAVYSLCKNFGTGCFTRSS